ncbi:hypothetical protein [Amphibacillus xylanus]|uniref:hypothetical protein n=1 Tax=Amphibacillus xylanus TaxID=1449 RepID=UPI00059E7F28|nr:hypothetical protein [Amphibacillus xylanus]
MKDLVFKILKYSTLFLALYLGSIIVVSIFRFLGAEYNNVSNVAFSATTIAFILLISINKFRNKNSSKHNSN